MLTSLCLVWNAGARKWRKSQPPFFCWGEGDWSMFSFFDRHRPLVQSPQLLLPKSSSWSRLLFRWHYVHTCLVLSRLPCSSQYPFLARTKFQARPTVTGQQQLPASMTTQNSAGRNKPTIWQRMQDHSNPAKPFKQTHDVSILPSGLDFYLYFLPKFILSSFFLLVTPHKTRR